MKKSITFLIASLLLSVAGVQTAYEKMVVTTMDNQVVKFDVSNVRDVTFEESELVINHEYVDLGLPSGTLWATCNIGANSPEEYGDYFSWGETETKENYTWNTYLLCEGTKTTMTKYCMDSSLGTKDYISALIAENDAAIVNLGIEWQMPSKEQLEELINSEYTTSEWTQENGVNGTKIMSKSNGKSIFLPAAGYYSLKTLKNAESAGCYWTRSLVMNNSANAYYLSFGSGDIKEESRYRYFGQNIRPVRKKGETRLVTQIVLSDEMLNLGIGETRNLTATVYPVDADNPSVVWESNDETVVTVNDAGLVKVKAYGLCTITCHATDGSGVSASFTINVECPYVDLGLPSGTLWAICNVGSSKPEGYGRYFAWGETQPKSDYSWSTYKWMNEGQSSWSQINKYTYADGRTDACWYNSDEEFIGDGLAELLPDDDAATANWGENWQIPSYDQMKELYNPNNTTTEWTTQNGINGSLIVSNSNGNTLFLPAAGYCEDTNVLYTGCCCNYWSRSPSTFTSWNAFCLLSSSDYPGGFGGNYRYFGRSVRPVKKQ